MESIMTILVGVLDPGDTYVSKALDAFKNDANLSQYIEIDNTDDKAFAKLANFVSQSISSQSQALGSGCMSQPLTF